MNDCQPLDNWIANYEADQRQKQQNFLRAVKYEFIERTTQQRRDRLNQTEASQRITPEHSASPRRALKSNHKIL
jgi:hypothetical protein